MTAVSVAPRPGTATVAASVMVRHLLAGPPQRASVVAAGPVASYLDVAGRMVAVVAPGGVQLPCALVLTGEADPPAGPGLAVGRRAVLQDERPVVVRRWFDPRVRVERIDPPAVARAARLLRDQPRVDALPAEAADQLAARLARGHVVAAAADLLGRDGPPPCGDDLLAGILAVLRALRSPAAGPWVPRSGRRHPAAPPACRPPCWSPPTRRPWSPRRRRSSGPSAAPVTWTAPSSGSWPSATPAAGTWPPAS